NGGTFDWANSGPPGAACANGGVNVTGTGGLFNCGVPGAGSNPPTAPTRTPAAAADASIISAVFIVDPISGDNPPCGPDDPTTLGGGQKNGDAITSYTFDHSTVPAKTELSNVYAVTHTRSDNSHPEIYFGAEKLTQNGDTHMDFEFLQSGVALTAGCSGSFTGNRTEGDLLVSVDFANGGAVPAASVHQWHCAVEPGPQPPDGTVCNPSGGPEHYQLISLAPSAAVTVNAANIPCGGWVCRDQDAAPSTTVVSANNFMEGGVDLLGIPFAGCFNSFLPHTRTSGAFTATLKDFAGPVALKSCRDPATSSNSAPGGNVSPGASVRDSVNVANGGAGLPPTGSVTFSLCSPAQVTGSGCAGGTQVGAAKVLVGGGATSDPTSSTNTAGKYCWRTVYSPDVASQGIYAPATHTNATTECFSVLVVASLPNTGVPDMPTDGVLPLMGLALLPGLIFALAWRRSRSITVLVIAGLVAGAGPSPSQPSAAGAASTTAQHHAAAAPSPSPSPPQVGSARAREGGWRLVIPRIGVDALIQPVGKDRDGAMASPSSLDAVGWFNRGPAPGQSGDAVIDGHYGLPQEPAVFRKLRLLRPGDEVQVVWPDGRTVDFEVTRSEIVPASSHPPDVFSRSGPSRLSLITCFGAWDESRATYSDRLIVTAMMS
ncbi:MAG: class F sortase, partial [Chloroflexi bacterium]